MNKLMYRFVATNKKKKRNRPVFRHGMPLQGIPRKKTLLKITWDNFFKVLYRRRALRVLRNSIPVWRALVVGPYQFN